MEPKVRYGTINCDCGQSFYFETVRKKVSCIKCDKEHDASTFPVKEEPPVEEGDPDGTDI